MLKLLPPYDVIIDWAPGESTTHTSSREPSTQYDYDTIAVPAGLSGTITPTIRGPVSGVDIRDLLPTHVHNYGRLSQNIKHVRAGNPNLIHVPQYLPSTITSLDGIISESPALNSANITSWSFDNPNTNLDGLFRNCASFNQNIEHWDVTNVASMNDMFNGAHAFDYNLTCWNVASFATPPLNFAPSLSPLKQPIWGQDGSNLAGRTALICRTIRSVASGLPIINKPSQVVHGFADSLAAYNQWAQDAGFAITTDPIIPGSGMEDDWARPITLLFTPTIAGTSNLVGFTSEGGFMIYESVTETLLYSNNIGGIGSTSPDVTAISRFYLPTDRSPSLVVSMKKPSTDAVSSNTRMCSNETVAIMYAEFMDYGGTDNMNTIALRLDDSGHIDICVTNVSSDESKFQMITMNESGTSRSYVPGFGGFGVDVPIGTTLLYTSRL